MGVRRRSRDIAQASTHAVEAVHRLRFGSGKRRLKMDGAISKHAAAADEHWITIVSGGVLRGTY
jgi:hypothetical protein